MDTEKERQKIERSFRSLEGQTNALFDYLKPYDDEILQTPVSSGVWSSMQVLTHLLLTEQLSLKYIQKKLSFQPELAKAGLKSRLRLSLLRIYLISPLKFKAPEAVQSQDRTPQCNLEEFGQIWQAERAKMKEFIRELDNDLLIKEVYKHPFVGRLSIAQMLQFFQHHFHRHEKQILKRLP